MLSLCWRVAGRCSVGLFMLYYDMIGMSRGSAISTCRYSCSQPLCQLAWGETLGSDREGLELLWLSYGKLATTFPPIPSHVCICVYMCVCVCVHYLLQNLGQRTRTLSLWDHSVPSVQQILPSSASPAPTNINNTPIIMLPHTGYDLHIL